MTVGRGPGTHDADNPSNGRRLATTVDGSLAHHTRAVEPFMEMEKPHRVQPPSGRDRVSLSFNDAVADLLGRRRRHPADGPPENLPSGRASEA